MMDASFVEKLTELGIAPQVLEVHEDDDERHVLVVGPGLDAADGQRLGAELRTYKKKPPLRNHVVHTLDALTTYLRSIWCGGDVGARGVVFVDHNQIDARLSYGQVHSHTDRIGLRLIHSAPFAALSALDAWNPPRVVWEALALELDGHVDKGLALSVEQLRVRTDGEEKITVDRTGLVSKKNERTLRVLAGTESVEVETSWLYDGPVFECLDRSYTVQLRLLVDYTDGNLRVRLAPVKLPDVMRDARADLAEILKERLTDKWLVVNGSY